MSRDYLTEWDSVTRLSGLKGQCHEIVLAYRDSVMRLPGLKVQRHENVWLKGTGSRDSLA